MPISLRLLVVAAGVLLSSAAAHAGKSALLLAPTVEGPLTPAEQAELMRAARDALSSQELDVIPPAEVEPTLGAEPQLKDCYSELCLERLGRLLAGQLVLRYRVKANLQEPPPGPAPANDPGPAWRLHVELLDVEVGAVGARLTEECTSCSNSQAADKLADMIKRAVLESASRPRGVLEVRSQPLGATVFVDGTELGITPYRRAAFAGPHKLVLRHTGFRSEQAEAQITEGEKRHVEVTLSSGSDPVQVVVIEKEKTPLYKKWWFWVAIGGAAAAAAAITAGVVVGTRSDDAAHARAANHFEFTF